MVHNTGGGFYDNIPRILPKGCKAVIDTGSWTPQPIFQFLEKMGEIPREEMYRTFNMGIGLLIIVNEEMVSDICHHFEAVGEEPVVIGKIISLGEQETDQVELV